MAEGSGPEPLFSFAYFVIISYALPRVIIVRMYYKAVTKMLQITQ
jgi:hypothetical protein